MNRLVSGVIFMHENTDDSFLNSHNEHPVTLGLSPELRAYKSESSLIEQRIKLDSRALSYGGAVYKDVHCRQSDRDV